MSLLQFKRALVEKNDLTHSCMNHLLFCDGNTEFDQVQLESLHPPARDWLLTTPVPGLLMITNQLTFLPVNPSSQHSAHFLLRSHDYLCFFFFLNSLAAAFVEPASFTDIDLF